MNKKKNRNKMGTEQKKSAMGRKEFLMNFLSDKNVASVTPSSKYAVKRICKKINIQRPTTIIEYGPGSGAYTKELLKTIHKDSVIIAVEKNKKFVEHLKEINDPRLKIVNDSAENIKKILTEYKVEKADYIISGIPFSFFEEHKRHSVIKESYDSLQKDGKFIAYQCTGKIKMHLKKIFEKVQTEIELINLPPLTIMEATKMEHN